MLKETLFLAAREYASMGMPIFPIIQNAKRPATSNGFYDATTDLDQIAAWYDPRHSDTPAYNIATCPDDSGCFVIDCDGEQGQASFAAFVLVYPALMHTLIVETPSGGRHYWYKGQLPPSARKLGPGIDTRGIGGYVLLPPSVIDGRSYKVISAHV